MGAYVSESFSIDRECSVLATVDLAIPVVKNKEHSQILRPLCPASGSKSLKSIEATDHGGGQTCDAAEGAKNLWLRTGRQWNLNLATFNCRTLSSEGSLAVLLEELSGIKWDVIGLSEVRRTDEAYTILASGHVLCYH